MTYFFPLNDCKFLTYSNSNTCTYKCYFMISKQMLFPHKCCFQNIQFTVRIRMYIYGKTCLSININAPLPSISTKILVCKIISYSCGVLLRIFQLQQGVCSIFFMFFTTCAQGKRIGIVLKLLHFPILPCQTCFFRLTPECIWCLSFSSQAFIMIIKIMCLCVFVS